VGSGVFFGAYENGSGSAAHDKFRPDLVERHADEAAALFDQPDVRKSPYIGMDIFDVSAEFASQRANRHRAVRLQRTQQFPTLACQRFKERVQAVEADELALGLARLPGPPEPTQRLSYA